MDTLILIGVVAAWSKSLIGAVTREVRLDAPHRYRLILEQDGAPRSVVVSVDPQRPWIGRPARRGAKAGGGSDPFCSQSARSLRGTILTGVVHRGRAAWLEFSGGFVLVAEMRPHQANLILLDTEKRVLAAARSTKLSRKRIEPGKPYAVDRLPDGLLDPLEATADQIEDALAAGAADGDPPDRALSRSLIGVALRSSALFVDDAAKGSRLGDAWAARVEAIESGALVPVIEAPEPPLEAAEQGRFDPDNVRLLPWVPGRPVRDGLERFAGVDAAATAGIYFESRDLSVATARRQSALRGIVEAEIRRHRHAEMRAREDLDRFADPDRFRRWGEALLAGLNSARRVGEQVLVADPYDPSGAELAIPARPAKSLSAVADDCFQQHRRGKRGLDRARERAESVALQRRRLEEIRAGWPETVSATELDRLESELRDVGVPVGLETTPRRRTSTRPTPRLEGVRLFTAASGASILVGKTARDNQRLTFKLAAPEDFWFHALGVPGAHVVLRNDERTKTPDRRDLLQAAGLAAWFSEAKAQPATDVQWTRRKYVRKLRGGPPGTVTVKRSETVRVRPSAMENAG